MHKTGFRYILPALALAVGVFMLQPAPAQAPAGTPGTVFNDWRLACGGPGLRDDQCYIMQTLTATDTKQRVLAVVAGNLGPEAKPILYFTLPLGIYLPAGMAFNIDGSEEFRAEVSVCLADGCKAMIEIDNKLRDLLNAGKQVKVAFLDAASRQQVLLEVSLLGFASGFAAL
jgi:invasion protein IalB